MDAALLLAVFGRQEDPHSRPKSQPKKNRIYQPSGLRRLKTYREPEPEVSMSSCITFSLGPDIDVELDRRVVLARV